MSWSGLPDLNLSLLGADDEASAVAAEAEAGEAIAAGLSDVAEVFAAGVGPNLY